MKTRSIIAILLFALFLFAACQPTPETEPVPNKGDNEMEAAIKTTPIPTEGENGGEGFVVPEYSVPEHWTESFAVGESETMIFIDADISIPKGAHPVYIVRDARDFDKDALNRIVQNFVDPQKWHSADPTRDELLEMLQKALDGFPTGEIDPQTGEQIIAVDQDTIDYLTEALLNIDPDVDWQEIASMPDGSGYVADEKRHAYYEQEKGFFSIREDKSAYPESELVAVQYSTLGINGRPGGVTALPEPSMTADEAITLANGLLADTGLDERLSAAYVTKAHSVDLSGEEKGVGWMVYCKLNTGGALLLDPEYYDFNAGPLGAPNEVNEAAFRPKSKSECLLLYFEDSILKSVSWTYPQEIVEVANPAVELLPFDRIQELVRRRIIYGLAWVGGGSIGSDIHITQIILTYLPSAKVNDLSEYYWSPMWAVVLETESNIPLLPNVFFINAIDGTFVTFSN